MCISIAGPEMGLTAQQKTQITILTVCILLFFAVGLTLVILIIRYKHHLQATIVTKFLFLSFF